MRAHPAPASHRCCSISIFTWQLPLEVVAILKVRQKLGLASPVIEHPLICTQTIAVEQLVLEPDDVVRKVEAAYEALRG